MNSARNARITRIIGIRLRLTAALTAAATLAGTGILLTATAHATGAPSGGATGTVSFSSPGQFNSGLKWDNNDGCKQALPGSIFPPTPISVAVHNDLDGDVEVYANTVCSGMPVATVQAGGENLNLKITGGLSFMPVSPLITRDKLLPRLRSDAPLPTTTIVDHASGATGIAPYSATENASSERSASQNNFLNTTLAINGTTATYNGVKYNIYKPFKSYTWQDNFVYAPDEKETNLGNLCKEVNCKFYGVLLSDNPAFTTTNPTLGAAATKYSDYPTLYRSATTTGHPIKVTETTTITNTDTITTGFKIGATLDSGTLGTAKVAATGEYNWSDAKARSEAVASSHEADYMNSAGRQITVESHANVGWYSGYLLIPTANQPEKARWSTEAQAIPVRMAVTSPTAPSPSVWHAVTPAITPVTTPLAPTPLTTSHISYKIHSLPSATTANKWHWLCMDVPNGNITAGQTLEIVDYLCDGLDNSRTNPSQRFVFADDGTLKVNTKVDRTGTSYCVDNGLSVGTTTTTTSDSPPPLYLSTCNGSSGQKWKRYSDGTIRPDIIAFSTKCVAPPTVASGQPLTLKTCNTQDTTQKWQFVPDQNAITLISSTPNPDGTTTVKAQYVCGDPSIRKLGVSVNSDHSGVGTLAPLTCDGWLRSATIQVTPNGTSIPSGLRATAGFLDPNEYMVGSYTVTVVSSSRTYPS
ncbi:ricin-type beta-trefoil lectin domain protein [Streptomyces sp. NPDC005533]|uniref:ricin-type beta-trefoil lectin domain protein n=1 Tax=Streptomyces sp. NPDC005533 TaxID=3364723 RepID=UPI003681D8A4